MEKLKKENIYINLQGKSEEELTELYNFLKILNYNIDSFDSFFYNKYLHFNTNWNRWWTFSAWNKGDSKQEVTIQQLKEILQPMETFRPIAMKCTQEQFYAVKPKLKHLKIFMFNKEWNSFYLALFEDGSITNGLIHSGDGEIYEEWNEEMFLKACGIEVETLEQQLEKAKAEVKRLEYKIEDSKIKVGDWVISSLNNCIFKCEFGRLKDDLTKITDRELINKLNNLIK